MRYQKKQPFKRGDPIVVTKSRKVQVGMLWGRGGRDRETIQYFNHVRISNFAERIEKEKYVNLRYPDIVYADTRIKWGGDDTFTVWDKKMHRYHKDNMTEEFRQRFDILFSYIARKYEIKTLFSYE